MIVPSSSSSSSQPSAAVDKNSKLTRLDRNIDVILKNPDQTPSRQAGITPEVERLHRFHGTSIIFECSRGLSLGPSTNATACTIFHRFYHSTSLIEYDVWSVAMASTLLATKVEEDAKNLKQIIEVYTNIYARRLMLADVSLDDEGENDESNDDDEKVKNNKTSSSTKQQELVLSSTHLCCLSESISKWATAKQRQRICADRLPQQLNKFGPMYKEWHAQITKMESILLRQLGFTFYWISDSHPHKFILNFCQALELDDNQFIQRVWDYCNDSCRLDLSVRYLPETIACSAIFLAARDFNIVLPIKPRPWWEIFLGNDENNKGNQLVDVANAIFGTCNLHLGMEKDCKEANEPKADHVYVDWLVATKGFVRSIDKEDSTAKIFNSPDSFLYLFHEGMFAKDIPNESSSI